MRIAKLQALISCPVCPFQVDFAYAKSKFSYDAGILT